MITGEVHNKYLNKDFLFNQALCLLIGTYDVFVNICIIF